VVKLVPITDADTVPTSVGRFLLPHERHVISVREHPVVLLWRALAVLAGLALAGYLTNSVVHGTAILIIWLLWVALLAWLVVRIAGWWVHYFVITSKRLILTTGILLKRVNAIPLDKITDIEFRQTQTGKLFHYGTFEVWSPNQDPKMRTFNFLPYPTQLYLEFSGLVFKEDKEDLGLRAGHVVTRTTPTAASSRPARCTQRMRSPSSTLARSTVIPGYSDVITTASPNRPTRVART
jgi:membrane protein YdbS with pleckstrin-like domain